MEQGPTPGGCRQFCWCAGRLPPVEIPIQLPAGVGGLPVSLWLGIVLSLDTQPDVMPELPVPQTLRGRCTLGLEAAKAHQGDGAPGAHRLGDDLQDAFERLAHLGRGQRGDTACQDSGALSNCGKPDSVLEYG